MARPRSTSWALALGVVLLLLLSPSLGALRRQTAVRVKDLTDENFEHDTQASTGQTTGRWLVLFLGEEPEEPAHEDAHPGETPAQAQAQAQADEPPPGDGQAGQAVGATGILHALMHIASEQYPREFIPAKVHLKENPKLAKRFSVAATPAIRLFRDGKMFAFPGLPASRQEIEDFINGGYTKMAAAPVPPPPSPWDELLEDLQWKYAAFRKRLAEDPALLGGVGLAVAALFYFLVSALLRGLGKSSPVKKGPQVARRAKRD